MFKLFLLGRQFQWNYCAFEPKRCDHDRCFSGAIQQAGGVPKTDGLGFQVVLFLRYGFQFEINQENMRYCNLLMKYGELFHNDRLKGNFLIVDGIKYLCYIMDEDVHGETQITKQLFHTTVKPFVDTQQYLFDNLCSKSIPAKEKIREIGKGIRGNFVDIFQTPSEIKKNCHRTSASSDI
jgi:hypothetical protein